MKYASILAENAIILLLFGYNYTIQNLKKVKKVRKVQPICTPR